MKRMKKIASLVLAMVMALAMTIPAFAQTVSYDKEEGGGTAKITINNASKGAKYEVYKIFDATYGNGNIAYTYSGELKENKFFTQNADGSITANAGVNFTESNSELISFLNGLLGENPSPYISKDNVEGTTLEFTGLAYGYYLIKSSVNNGAAITLDSTTPNATVNDKNVPNPGWDPDPEKGGKKIVSADGTLLSENSASYGDTVKFQLSINALNYSKENNDYKQIENYVITDTFASKAFDTLEIESIKIGNQTIQKADDDSEKGYILENVAKGGFKITIPWAKNTANEDQTPVYKSFYASNQPLVVTYTLKLKESAEIAGSGNVNRASLAWNYVNNGGTGTPGENTDQVTATVYTYALAINKVDPKGNPLEDAVFSLKNGTVVIPVAQDGNAKGTYKYDPKGTATLTSGQDGLVVVKGLAAGTYTVQETKAPAGYNLLTASKDITASIEKTTTYTTTITYYTDAEGNVVDESENTTAETKTAPVKVSSITVVNNAGTELPSTGGIGTTIFYIIGGILVVGAAVLLVTKKRMSREA